MKTATADSTISVLSKTIAIMKKFLSIFGSVAIVAAILSGCVKDENVINSASKKRIVTITANAEDSRTVLDEENMRVNWDELDYENMQLIEVGHKGDGNFEELQRATATGIELQEGGKTAKFTFEFGKDYATEGYTQFAYRAIMIYGNKDLGYGKQSEYYIKNTQDPTPDTFDPRADILIAKPQGTFDASQNALDFQFARAVAVTKMTLKGVESGSLIRSVSFITDEEHGTAIVGEVQPTYDAEGNGSLTFVGNIEGYDNNRVTMSYLDRPLKGDGSFDVYFLIAPVTLQANKDLTVRVVTTTKYYEKVITLPNNLRFRTDKINKLSVDMSGCGFEPQYYTLVTDASSLKAGDQIIICNTVSSKALSISQNDNNRVATDIVIDKSKNTAAYNKGIQIITLENGSKESTVAFNVGNGYLYAASSDKNYLRTQTSVDNNASWIITIDKDDNYKATINAQGTNTHSMIQYNTSSKLFSCYLSTNPQSSVWIYRYVAVPVISPIEEQLIGSAAGDYPIKYTVASGTDDFAVVGVDGCVKSASISTPGTITVTVDENASESRVEGDVIIASKAYPDVTAKVQIIQAAKGEKEPLDKPQNIEFKVTATDLTAKWGAVNYATKYGYRVVYKADETATGEEIANGETNDAEISISASSLGLTEFAAGEYVLYVKSLGNENFADSDEESKAFSLKGNEPPTEVPTSGIVLWAEDWDLFGGSSTTFTQNSLISDYTYTGRSGYKENAKSVTCTTDNNVRATTSSGANCISGHLWFNKSVDGTLTTSAIKLYGATSLTFSHSQGTSGSLLTSSYSTDDGNTWIELGSQSGPIATKTYNFTVADGTESIKIKLYHPKSNAKNTRVDNLVLKVQ